MKGGRTDCGTEREGGRGGRQDLLTPAHGGPFSAFNLAFQPVTSTDCGPAGSPGPRGAKGKGAAQEPSPSGRPPPAVGAPAQAKEGPLPRCPDLPSAGAATLIKRTTFLTQGAWPVPLPSQNTLVGVLRRVTEPRSCAATVTANFTASPKEAPQAPCPFLTKGKVLAHSTLCYLPEGAGNLHPRQTLHACLRSSFVPPRQHLEAAKTPFGRHPDSGWILPSAKRT